ncbi:MAG: primosomal protein N' [Dehalococcoidia bacterium]|nr:primosomal protein N' [Dehalococcoidia bacterium]
MSVAVDAPLAPGRCLTYSVPATLDVQPGHALWVPLGARLAFGVAMEVLDSPPPFPTRPIAGLVDPEPLLPPPYLSLAQWLSETTLSPLMDAVALCLPPGYRRRVRRVFAPTQTPTPPKMPEEAHKVWNLLSAAHPFTTAQIQERLGRAGVRGLRWLLAHGLVASAWCMERPRVRHKNIALLHLASTQPPTHTLSARQQALLEHLRAHSPLPLASARKEFGASAVHGLLRRGLASVEYSPVVRDPLAGLTFAVHPRPSLTAEQQQAYMAVAEALEGRSPRRVFLLYGVTGSGKTEVYLRALEHCLALGKRAIYLVPEISLTPQLVERVGSRFPEGLGLLHSGLSLGQRFDTWWRARQGQVRLLLGARSAVFAPLPHLGLIVLDEEHDPSYKQDDLPPRYHTREVALQLARLTGAVVLMGSATPSVTSTYQAQRGDWGFLTLPYRIRTGAGGEARPGPLPRVEVVDMREELKAGNKSIFSRALQTALEETLAKGLQAILFLNRRGAVPVVQCRECGETVRCPSCDFPFTLHHQPTPALVCHHCGRRRRVIEQCPACGSTRVRHLGIGVQRVASEVEARFGVRPLRWDRDVAHRFQEHWDILARMERGESPILVGTQMVAKGLHLPRVALVGVILADVGLTLPDPFAGERVFQVLCQVAGRAGREEEPGRVIIQTYRPDHYALAAATRQDFLAFYTQEIARRQRWLDPPFRRLALLRFRHTNPQRAQREAYRLATVLREAKASQGLSQVDIVGPAPAYPPREKGHYRWHILVRAPDPVPILRDVPIPLGWSVDIDPVALM